MANNLTKFEFEGKGVRTVVVNGEPWFVAKDVCEILDLENVTMALSSLEDDERITLNNPDGNPRAGNPLTFNCVSESGLYAIVFKSRKENAKKFRKWVTSEVLPQIRKTGRYEAPVASLLPAEIAVREFKAYYDFALTVGLEGNAARISADNTVRRERGISLLQITQIELKTENQEQMFTPTQIGEILGFEGHRGAKKVNKLLSYLDFQERVGDSWVVTEKGKPYAVILDTGKKHKSGTMVQQIKWKESVIPKIEKLLDEDDD